MDEAVRTGEADRLLGRIRSEAVLTSDARIAEISLAEMGSSIACHRPFIVRQHPAVERTRGSFELASLAGTLGDREITVEHKHRFNSSRQKIRAREYLENIDSSDFYWRQVDLSAYGVAPPMPCPVHCRSDAQMFDHGWIGPADTVQTFHQDNHDEYVTNNNLFVQVVGSKYIAIASPDDSGFFRSMPLSKSSSRHSMASPLQPETWVNCPTLAHAVVCSGDIVYIPPRFWHYLRSLTPSISVSRWWFDSRVAEILYRSSDGGIHQKKIQPHDVYDFPSDLAGFGGRAALDSVLGRLQISERYLKIMQLIEVYGKGVLCDG